MKHEDANGFHRFMRLFAASRPVSWLFARTLHHVDRLVFRLTDGAHTFASLVSGLPVVMLTTTGARSGDRVTLPLLGIPHGDETVVVASNYGRPRNPSWYYNLRAASSPARPKARNGNASGGWGSRSTPAGRTTTVAPGRGVSP